MPTSLTSFQAGLLSVAVFPSVAEMAAAAAQRAALVIQEAIRTQGSARIIVATGNSQIEMISRLVRLPGIDWSRVDAFHMDEYVGLSREHPASFRRWIKTRFADVAQPRSVEYLEGDAADLDAEMQRYTKLLQEAPIDLCLAGIGENGHIAFNDPPVADFQDPRVVKVVTLDEACRRQQVGEGHFSGMDTVPAEALSLTCPALMAARVLLLTVPDHRKARAVRDSLQGPVTTACPASITRTHPHAYLFLDSAAAAELPSV